MLAVAQMLAFMNTFQNLQAIGKKSSPPIAAPTPKNTPALGCAAGCKLATKVGVRLELGLGMLLAAEGMVFEGRLGPNPTPTPIAEVSVGIGVGGAF